jgi:hypothetical protein
MSVSKIQSDEAAYAHITTISEKDPVACFSEYGNESLS